MDEAKLVLGSHLGICFKSKFGQFKVQVLENKKYIILQYAIYRIHVWYI